jgi:exopolysaccharide biosynthesis protein
MGFLIASMACAGLAEATPVKILGLNPQWPLETRGDLGGATGDALDERVPLSAMARFGVQADVLSDGVRLSRSGFALEYHNEGGWKGATEELAALLPPVQVQVQTWLPVRVLASLGFNVRLEGTGITVEPLPETPEVPNQVVDFRVNRGRSSRLVLDLGRAALPTSSVEPGRVRVVLTNTLINPRFSSVSTESVSRLRALQDGRDAVIEVEIALRAAARAFTVTDPERLVIDAETPDEAPPAPGTPPSGVTFVTNGDGTAKLSLVTVDSRQFKPAVVAAPWGGTRSVLEHAQRANAVVAVNGGYFDGASSASVDLALSGGALLAYARGNRATFGLLENSVVFGTPRVRLTVGMSDASALNVNALGPKPNPSWLTAFVGDGFVPVGSPGFVTLVIGPQPVVNGVSRTSVLERRTDVFTPAPGLVTLTFSPATFANLDRLAPGSPINLSLAWSDAAWANVVHALAAGPMLVRGGQYAVNAAQEGFDTTAEIWRSTRQVAFGLDAQGRYVIALLEQGTPEEFARALVKAGLVDAVRLDSGSSAAVYVAGGMLSARWGRTVPNALVFVPR